MRVLFVCNQGRHRSRTAAELFSGAFETRYAGLYGNEIAPADLSWAEVVCVMEEHQRSTIADRFPNEYLSKRILSLDIPDVYSYGQPELVRLLNQRVAAAIPRAAVLHPPSRRKSSSPPRRAREFDA